MVRLASVQLVPLRSSLVNLPISIYGPLLERGVRPQSLAVHLKLASSSSPSLASPVYLGWSGLAAASSLARLRSATRSGSTSDTIELDPQYAHALGFQQDDVVEIGLLYDLPVARTVGAEPVSSDDWEIIEIHATNVETTLLSQVRVAQVGQEIDVWVMGNTRVRLRVVSVSPEAPALLLTADTEVSVAPKPHAPGAPTHTTLPVAAAAVGNTKAKVPSRVLRVLPSRLFALPAVQVDDTVPVAFVSQRTFASLARLSFPLTPAQVVVPDERRDSDSKIPTSPGVATEKLPAMAKRLIKARLRRLPPPSKPEEPHTTSDANNKLTTANTTTPTEGGTHGKQAEPKEMLAWIAFSAALPISGPQLVLVGGVEVFDGRLKEWDLVRATPTDEHHENAACISPPRPVAPITVTWRLAGVDKVLAQCTEWCLSTLALQGWETSSCGVPVLLITGRPGAGKTAIARAVAEKLQEDPRTFTNTHYIDCTRHASQSVASLKALFKYWLDTACWHCPSVLILDNLERLLGAEVEHSDSTRARLLTELFIATFGTRTSRGVLVLATATGRTAVHPLLCATHLVKDIVEIPSLSREARKEILTFILRNRLAQARTLRIASEASGGAPINSAAIATQTEGYSPTDLNDLVSRAIHVAASRSCAEVNEEQTVIRASDFDDALADLVPLGLRDIKLQKPDVAWADIGGLHTTRRVLRETLEWPTKYAQIFAQCPLRLRSGILLYGFPGCGKTLLASAVAKECGLSFISVKGPELLNKYIGASEKAVRDLFDRATAAKPCVLFFDEFDAIAPKRGHDSTGVTDRVVNQLLTQMDGAEGLDGVYVLAATSRPDLIDPALLRPGRLDKALFCDMPTEDERTEILQAIAHQVDVSSNVDWGWIATRTAGFSGADLQAMVYNAHLEVVHAMLSSGGDSTQSAHADEETPIEYTYRTAGAADKANATRAEEEAMQRRLKQIKVTQDASRRPLSYGGAGVARLAKKYMITQDHFERVLQTTKPSVSAAERKRLTRIYEAFIGDRSGDLPHPPEAGGVGNRASLM